MVIYIQSRSRSDPPLSEIDFRNYMGWVWLTEPILFWETVHFYPRRSLWERASIFLINHSNFIVKSPLNYSLIYRKLFFFKWWYFSKYPWKWIVSRVPNNMPSWRPYVNLELSWIGLLEYFWKPFRQFKWRGI